MGRQIIGSSDTFGEGWTKQNENNVELYDAITKNIKSVRFPLVFNTPGSFNIGSSVPVNTRIQKTIINVVTGFDGTTESTLTIGDGSVQDRFCKINEVNLSISDVIYEIDNYYNYTSSTQLTGTYVQDSATIGAAYIEIIYSIE